MRLRARDGEARDFLKKVAQKLLIIGCSANTPSNNNLKGADSKRISSFLQARACSLCRDILFKVGKLLS
jgi:hypothetical protein